MSYQLDRIDLHILRVLHSRGRIP
ncbi:Lrp/AsnC family transcriptional regulator, partial [Vibrio parahaemolyticus]|nr:Lrp/AsnC family transcriptional regulator [Vibrio parahaemolyticus]